MKKKIALLLSVVLVFAAVFMDTDMSGVQTVSAATTPKLEELLNMDELCGWATVSAEGLDGVTGGGNATPQVVTTMEEFETLASDNIPRVIVVSGTITCGSYGARVGSNKTIVGIDENATIYGGIRMDNASNTIISNLNMQGCWPNNGPDDCLQIKNCHHLWLNHLNIWNSWDGNVDITLGSDYITVSWCKFWYTNETNDGTDPEQDHRLSCLVGSGTGHDDTDMDKLKITYHHNWFADNVHERMPRVMYGRSHIYNNYYSCRGNLYCIGADCYASILVENNYFDRVNNPHQFSYGTGFPSSIVARGNKYSNTSGKRDTGQGSTTGGYAVPFETTVYDYYRHDAEDIPEIVQKYTGPQDMSDASVFKGEMARVTQVAGVEDTVPDLPEFEQETQTSVNDNPITYNAATDTYTYHGTNSDGTNGYYTIKNPFARKDYSETPTYSNGKPVWTKGATISYWVKVPTGATDAAVLNFNLKHDRQMERSDAVKYNLCQNYSETDNTYSMGTKLTYVDENGKEYTALKGYGINVQYNPNYPKEGYYTPDSSGGAYKVHLKGTDASVASNWTYLNYIGAGLYEEYSRKFDEAGGENSKIKEAKISGSLSLYASGSMGYRQDNWTGLQMNPNLYSYGSVLAAQIYNQYYYWGNGSDYTLKGSTLLTPVMSKKNEWHFVVAVIENDWIQYYMDGTEMTTDYLNWWGNAINVNTASESFNLGYGHRKNYKSYTPTAINATGMTILEFISDPNTILTVGGMGACAENLGQNTIGTPSGTQVKNIQFYYTAVDKKCILEDKIDLSLAESKEEAPDKIGAAYSRGDTDGDGFIDIFDIQALQKHILELSFLTGDAFEAGDVNQDGIIDIFDIQKIQKHILELELIQ